MINMETLEKIYNHPCQTYSDIQEHLPTIKKYNSVFRHRFKRLVREVFRKNISIKSSGLDFLIVILVNNLESSAFCHNLELCFNGLTNKK